MKESDDELMERCSNGDLSAFDLIVQRHKTPLINFVYRFLNNYETAEDLTQEVFIRIYKNIHKYRPDKASFRTWMYRIASNLCKNELRNRNRHSKTLVSAAAYSNDDDNVEKILSEASDTSPTPDQELEEHELQSILSKAIAELPDKFRTVLILRDVQEMPYEDISKIIKKPIGTVKSRINRARLMLKDKMVEYL